MDDIRERLRSVLKSFLDSREIPYDERNLDDLGSLDIDSLGFVELVFEIEDEFKIKPGAIGDDQIEDIKTLDDLANLIATARSA